MVGFISSSLQATYNVWKDKEDWLNVIDGVQNILATSVDTVTENIFYIVNDHFSSLKTVIKTDQEFVDLGDGVRRDRVEVARLVCGRVLATLATLERLGLAYNTVSPDTILLDTGGQIFLQNQLIVKSHPGKRFNETFIDLMIFFSLENLTCSKTNQSKIISIQLFFSVGERKSW